MLFNFDLYTLLTKMFEICCILYFTLVVVCNVGYYTFKFRENMKFHFYSLSFYILFKKNIIYLFFNILFLFTLLALSQYPFSTIYFLKSDILILSSDILVIQDEISLFSMSDNFIINKNVFSKNGDFNILFFLFYTVINVYSMDSKLISGPFGLVLQGVLGFIALWNIDACNDNCSGSIPKSSNSNKNTGNPDYYAPETPYPKTITVYERTGPKLVFKNEEFCNFSESEFFLKALQENLSVLLIKQEFLFNRVAVFSEYYDFCSIF